MQVNFPFLGYELLNESRFYSGGDEEEPFVTNLRTQPDDWYYRNAEITYDYNEYGHRCKNIADINLDNYILFTGCSHTEGIGLELENTYCYQVARALNCDYYNLAIAGTGIDVMIHNLTAWYLTVEKRPKYLFVQWPDETRFVIVNNGYADPHGSWKKDGNVSKFIYHADAINFFSSRRELAVIHTKLMAAGSNLVTINAMKQLPVDETPLRLSRIDFARDLSHPGIISHAKLTKQILACLSDKY